MSGRGKGVGVDPENSYQLAKQMNLGRIRRSGNENVFKGSLLVSTLLERNPRQFRSRAAAVKFARRLFRDGIIRSIFGADTFEDSVQFYTWNEKEENNMSSFSPPTAGRQSYSHVDKRSGRRENGYDQRMVDDVRDKILRREEKQPSSVNTFFKQLEEDFPEDTRAKPIQNKQFASYHTSWNLQRASTASSESSVDILAPAYSRPKDRNITKHSFPPPLSTLRDHDVIPEEAPEDRVIDGPCANTIDFDGSSSIPRSVATTLSSTLNDVEDQTPRRWQDSQNSYSDNEKQLIEQMKRMKKEHQHILRTYEDRINKLMAKMHELRSIAEMLENSSTKSSPYGIIPTKAGILNFLGSKLEQERKQGAVQTQDPDVPPPLPPRPGRGSELYPNKPIVHTDSTMKPLLWNRVILSNNDPEGVLPTIWHTMSEPKLDAEEVERLFGAPAGSQTDGATLYDDLVIRRGNSRQQLAGIFESEKSKRIIYCMRCLRATLTDVVGAVSSLETSHINHDSLAELIEHMAAGNEIERVLHYVRKKGAGPLDHPEYLVFELSKVDHFRDRLEFIRFRYRLQWHLFEIEQQLRELHSACDELSNSLPLRHLLETLLTVGNYLNGGTEHGQADGFGLEILNKIKDLQDRDAKSNLLEFVLKTYCQVYETEAEIGCPTRFRLPEPSNMRHAAQVSFEGVQDALSSLYSDLRNVREKLLDPKVNKDTTRPTDSFRVTAENFFAAGLEVIAEQEKVLQDTRDHFEKTVAYFVLEVSEVSPQDFFQIWAIFLHDCKFFWKLAHRRLAKERFELEFKYKGQLSAVSLHGYGSFCANMNRGVTQQPIISESKAAIEDKFKHIDNWMESLENVDSPQKPSVPPKPLRDYHSETHNNEDDQSRRSASPKPLTSTPPTSSDVYKPTPKPPAIVISDLSTQTFHTLSSAGAQPVLSNNVSPNYENQSQYDRLGRKYSKGSPPKTEPKPSKVHTPSSVAASDPKRSQQFSLKSWLKRERESVRRGVEGTVRDEQENSKATSPSKSFAKFRNSVVQRFTGANGSKRNQEKSSSLQSKPNVEQPKEDIPPSTKPALKFDRYGRLETETQYDALKNNYHQYNGNVFNPSQEEKFTSNHEQPLVNKVSAVDHEYPVNSNTSLKTPWTNDAVVSPERHKMGINVVSPLSDMNNNDKQISSSAKSGALLMPNTTNSSTTDAFRQGHGDLANATHPRDNTSFTVNAAVDSKRVQANPVPTYKAKVINNYENQGKFDPAYAPRQQAEPVRHGKEFRGRSSGTHSNRQDHTGEDPYYRGTRRNDPYSLGTPEKGATSVKTSSGYTSSPSRRYDDRQYNQNVSSQNTSQQSTPKRGGRETLNDNHRYLNPGTRAPLNVQSITSLIDRFDGSKVSDENHNPARPFVSHSNIPPALPAKPITMTSTPVASRKEIPNGIDNQSDDSSPPLPPRSDLNANRPAFSPIANSSSANLDNHLSPRNNNNNSSSNSNNTDASPYSRKKTDNYRSPENNISGFSPVVNNVPPNMDSYRSPDILGNRSQTYLSPTDKYSNYQSPNQVSSYTSRSNYTLSPPVQDTSSQFRNQTASDNVDDVYSVQLRRAANTSSVFDRYQKPSPTYQSRSAMYSPASTSHTSPGSTAVVKPSVIHKGSISYMEI